MNAYYQQSKYTKHLLAESAAAIFFHCSVTHIDNISAISLILIIKCDGYYIFVVSRAKKNPYLSKFNFAELVSCDKRRCM
ncbi:hypothetical protein EDWATA_03349 [Edwardsiella tarda ATCC 23685]|uniref:Uncharacterized protein n=1 Tax=Edwardsiella tarda ATCC 23685 TaxID=500638 RepID=D4F991_EDWTA|nr:hypothetical protein EDWATA_03349 [Edwardsiella tarda ATCC 23685]